MKDLLVEEAPPKGEDSQFCTLIGVAIRLVKARTRSLRTYSDLPSGDDPPRDLSVDCCCRGAGVRGGNPDKGWRKNLLQVALGGSWVL